MKLSIFLWLAIWIVNLSQACQNLPEYFGTLDSSLIITSSTLASPSGGSCSCCGLCHQSAECSSFSYRADTGACTLYRAVGGYAQFTRDGKTSDVTQFFFLPGRSRTGEFCRTDADCVSAGEACRGRVCTVTDSDVTCRVIWQQNNALPDHRYYGRVNGEEMILHCRMEAHYRGATMVLASHSPPTDGVAWTPDNLLYKQHPGDRYPRESADYSILKYADIIRDLRTDGRYEVFIIANQYGSNGQALQTITADRSLSLTSEERIGVSSGRLTVSPSYTWDASWFVFPHRRNIDSVLYSTLVSTTSYLTWRGIVKANGLRPTFPEGQERDTVLMYIRE